MRKTYFLKRGIVPRLKKCALVLAAGSVMTFSGGFVGKDGLPEMAPMRSPVSNVCMVQNNSQKLIKQLRENTVLIQSRGSQGSGVIISRKNDKTQILTNRHVIEDGFDENGKLAIKVRNNGEIVTVERVLLHPADIDLAIAEVKENIGPPANIAKKIPKIGESIYVVGSPLGFEDTVTGGIISNLIGSEVDYSVIQSDAAINPGNSGGGFFHAETGELVGITTFKIMVDENRTAEGMGFAIPITILTKSPMEDWKPMEPPPS
jgi:S1-C subfamily serine protease